METKENLVLDTSPLPEAGELTKSPPTIPGRDAVDAVQLRANVRCQFGELSPSSLQPAPSPLYMESPQPDGPLRTLGLDPPPSDPLRINTTLGFPLQTETIALKEMVPLHEALHRFAPSDTVRRTLPPLPDDQTLRNQPTAIHQGP